MAAIVVREIMLPTQEDTVASDMEVGANPGSPPMQDFHRIRRLPPYVFEQVNRAKAKARNAGADIIDLGMGNPDLPAPAHVVEKLRTRQAELGILRQKMSDQLGERN